MLVAGIAAATVSETRGGWTIGVGGEYAFLNWLTGFIEYDFYGFGNNGNAFACGVAVCAGFANPAYNVKTNINVIKAGLDFKFGG